MDYFKTSEDFEILWKAIEKELRDKFKSASDVQVESVLRVVRSVALYTWNSAQENAVPSGCVVIPKEPTEKMLNATLNLGYPAVYIDSISGQHKMKVKTEYKAMIEAAQEQDHESE